MALAFDMTEITDPSLKMWSMAAWWRAARTLGSLPVLGAMLVLAIVLATARGTTAIPPLETARIILNASHLTHFAQTWDPADAIIILGLRLPRVLGAALVGAALGVAGTLLQGLLRNPLADPYLMGTSAGASLGVTLVFLAPSLFEVVWLGFSIAALAAFLGALLAVALVYRLATRRGQTPVVTLLLAGVAVGAIVTAFQTLLVSVSHDLGLRFYALYNWIAGDIQIRDWDQVAVATGFVLAGTVLAILIAPWLDAFALGEEMAGHLGIHIERAKLIVVLLASVLVAAAVACSGLVGFVGLVTPHLCRLVIGPQHRLLIPATALGGALFVVLADLLARTVAGTSELPLGVITALVGGPFFLWLLNRSGEAYRW